MRVFSSKRKIPANAGSTAIFRAVPLPQNFLIKVLYHLNPKNDEKSILKKQ